jgi:hypothetical protein
MRPLIPLAGLAAVLTAAACGTATGLPAPILDNVVDTITLSALTGPLLTAPSGFSLPARSAIRTDETSLFDFAFDITPDGRPLFLPLLAMHLDGGVLDPGFIPQAISFDAIQSAGLNGYNTTDSMSARPGLVYIARSRMVCTQLQAAEYAKMEVLAYDSLARTVTFQVMVNVNCGYRDLQPGLPKH